MKKGTVAAGRAGLIDACLQVREAAGELIGVLHRVEQVIDDAAGALEAGQRASDSYQTSGFNTVRDDLFVALAKFDEAFSRARAYGVRVVIDEEGATFTEVARLVGRSRQFVTRLYRKCDE